MFPEAAEGINKQFLKKQISSVLWEAAEGTLQGCAFRDLFVFFISSSIKRRMIVLDDMETTATLIKRRAYFDDG